VVTPEEIRSREFFVDGRGYDRNEVQAFLASVADEHARLTKELAEARESGVGAVAADPVDVLGQHVADIVRASRDAADQLLQDAQTAAVAYRSLAEEQARRVRTEADEDRAAAAAVLADAEAHRSKVIAACELMTSQLMEATQHAHDTIRSLRPPVIDLRDEVNGTHEPEPAPAYGDG
jgi:DivIVA domain-containing protein